MMEERIEIILTDVENDCYKFLKITPDQKRLLDYLIKNGWMTGSADYELVSNVDYEEI